MMPACSETTSAFLNALAEMRAKELAAIERQLVAVRDAFYPRLQKLAAKYGWTLTASRKVGTFPLRFLSDDTLSVYVPWNGVGPLPEDNHRVRVYVRTPLEDASLRVTLSKPEVVQDSLLPGLEQQVVRIAPRLPPAFRTACLVAGWDGADTAAFMVVFLRDEHVPPPQHQWLEVGSMPPPPPRTPKRKRPLLAEETEDEVLPLKKRARDTKDVV